MKRKLEELLETLDEARRQIADAKISNSISSDIVDALEEIEAELQRIKEKLDNLTES